MVDAPLWLSQSQAVLSSVASTPFDFGDVTNTIGMTTKKFKLRVQIAAKYSGSMTSLTVAWQSSADNSTYADTGIKLLSILKANLLAGADIMDCDLPGFCDVNVINGKPLVYPATTTRRYGRFNYTLNGGKSAAGSINAWIDTY